MIVTVRMNGDRPAELSPNLHVVPFSYAISVGHRHWTWRQTTNAWSATWDRDSRSLKASGSLDAVRLKMELYVAGLISRTAMLANLDCA